MPDEPRPAAEEIRRALIGDAPTLAPASASSPVAPGPDQMEALLAPARGEGEIGWLGPYRVLRVLGAGGMGVVFQAEDPRLGRPVALKAMLPDVARRPEARERFLGEARAAAKLEHDNVVAIFAVEEDRGVPYIAMPLLKGASLEDRLSHSPGPLPLSEVLRLGREVACGLAAAHAAGLVHRDIKPANVWLDGAAGGRARILDFGLARASADQRHLTQANAILGTPAYMAPEQARGEKVDPRADLFSLGVVLYRLCTGKLPFGGNDMISTLMAVASDEPPSPSAVNSTVPAELSALIMGLLAKGPESRPGSAEEVARRLQALETGLAPSPGLGPASKPTGAGRALLVGALAVGALALMGAGAWWLLSPPPASPPVQKAETPAGSKEDGWLALFNGKDLSGWKAPPGQLGGWLVANGVLVGKSPPAAYLFSQRGDFADFHLRVEARVNAGGNGGVFIRAPFRVGGRPAGLPGLSRPLVKPGEWFTYEVFARGRQVRLAVNGNKVGAMAEPDAPPTGHIALQAVGPGTVVEFRKVEIKVEKAAPLPPDNSTPFDRLRRERVPPARLARAGGGDASLAPPGVVAVLGTYIVDFACSPRGNTVAVVYQSGKDPKSFRHKLALWDVDTGAETSLGAVPANRLLFSPDGWNLALSLFHGQSGAVIWDVRKKAPAQQLGKATNRHHCFAFTPDSRGVYFGSPNRERREKGDRLAGAAVAPVSKRRPWKPASFEKGDVEPSELALSRDGAVLAAAVQNTVRAWDAASGTHLLTQTTREKRPVKQMALGGKGRLLVYVEHTNKGSVGRIDLGERKALRPFTAGPGQVASVAFHPDGATIATCDHAGVVKVWHARTLKVKRTLKLHWPGGPTGDHWRVEFTPEGRHLLALNPKGLLLVVRLEKLGGAG